MSKLEFAYEFFGKDNVTNNKISTSTIDTFYNDFIRTGFSFKLWKSLLNTRA